MRLCLLAVLAGLIVSTSAAASVPFVDTVDGPATLYSPWKGIVTYEGRATEVLTAVKVTVAAGGREGPVRVRVLKPRRDGEPRAVLLGPWVDLAASEGVHTLPAPHAITDYRDNVIALDQQSGGHRIVRRFACHPEDDEFDPCRERGLMAFAPVLAGDVDASSTPPTLQRPGEDLALQGVWEYDRDGDLAGDNSEDRTRLRIRATTHRIGRHRVALALTVSNRGPRAANLPSVAISAERTGLESARVLGGCRRAGSFHDRQNRPAYSCRLPPVPVGSSHTATISLPHALEGGRLTVRVDGDGPNLGSGDLVSGTLRAGRDLVERPHHRVAPLETTAQTEPRVDSLG